VSRQVDEVEFGGRRGGSRNWGLLLGSTIIPPYRLKMAMMCAGTEGEK
jgi:hypothetical protein